MAISKIASLGSGECTASGSLVLTTTAAHTAGDQIVVGFAAISNAANITGVVDSAGNTYTRKRKRTGGTNGNVDTWVSNGVNALASGGTITATFSLAATAVAIAHSARKHLVATLDSSNDATNTTGNPDCTNTTIAASTISYVFVGLTTSGAGSADVLTETWSDGGVKGHSTANLRIACQYQINTSAGAHDFTGFVNGGTVIRWVTVLVAFEEGDPNLPAGSGFNGLLLMDCGT